VDNSQLFPQSIPANSEMGCGLSRQIEPESECPTCQANLQWRADMLKTLRRSNAVQREMAWSLRVLVNDSTEARNVMRATLQNPWGRRILAQINQ
jgi:hypothetical protein